MFANSSVELWEPLGSCIANLPEAKGISFSGSAGEDSTFSFSMNAEIPEAKLIREMFTDVVVYRNNVKTYRGRIMSAPQNNEGGGPQISVTAVTYKTLLKRRFYIVDTIVATSTDLETAAWNAINHVQTRASNGTFDLGIRRGYGQSVGVTLSSPMTITAGTSVDKVIDTLAQTNTSVNAAASFEWDIDPEMLFRVYKPLRGNMNASFTADFGGSVVSYSQDFDPSSYSNRWYVRGNGSYSGNKYSEEGLRPPPGGIFEDYVNDSELTSAQLVDAKAFWLATYNGQLDLCKTYSLTLSNSAWNGPQDLWVGDFVNLDIKDGILDVQTNKMRVKSIQISVNSNGYEGVAIEVGYSVAATWKDTGRMSAWMQTMRKDILVQRSLWWQKQEQTYWKEYQDATKKNGAGSYESNASLKKYQDYMKEFESWNQDINGGESPGGDRVSTPGGETAKNVNEFSSSPIGQFVRPIDDVATKLPSGEKARPIVKKKK